MFINQSLVQSDRRTEGLWFIWIVMRDLFFLPCDTKQGESYRVFDEQCVVLCRHQQGRSRQWSKHKRTILIYLTLLDLNAACRVSVCSMNYSVWVHTQGCYDRSLWGTRPAPHTSWCYSHTLPSFLLQTDTGNTVLHIFIRQTDGLKVELYLLYIFM